MTVPKRARALLAAALAASLLAGAVVLAPAGAAPSTRPSAEAISARVRVPSRTTDPANPRLDPRLAALTRVPPGSARTLAEAAGVPSDDEGVAVVVQAADAGEAERAVAAAGGKVKARAAGSVLARVHPSSLGSVASAPGVLRVRPPLKPRSLLTTPTEGIHISGADLVQSDGVTGEGVKVGIIDVGFHGYSAFGTEGYLPSGSQVATALFDAEGTGMTFERDPSGQPAPHGCAVAEIVHEMAPGAKLYLAAVGSEFDLAPAVEWMNDNGVQVVNMSLGWIGTPLDGGRTTGADNVVNSAVNTAVGTYGMFWANAAGNFRLNHWKGDFSDRDGDFALNWDGRAANLNSFYYDPSTGPIEGILWWRDTWTPVEGGANGALNDYDLVLFKYNESLGQFQSVGLGGQGESYQWGRTGDQPYEEVYWATPSAGWYAWAIVNMRPWPQDATSQHRWLPANNARVDFDFFCPNQELDVRVASRSIMTPADNESSGFMAVGAFSAKWRISPYDKYFRIGDPGFGQQELYSSEGPTQRGVLSPEIAAPDNVSNHVIDSFYRTTFRGTSAASPHLAGAAALALDRFPSLTAAQLESHLRANALGLAGAGADNQTGHGALRVPPVTPPAVEATRVAGADRYRTSLAISKSWASGSATEVVVASGAGFADALAGSSLAGALRCPIVLTHPAGTLPEMRAELHRLGVEKVHVLGSAKSVYPAVEQQLRAEGFAVVRHYGATRYDTAAAVASASLDAKPADTAFIVNGASFADPLAAAPIAYSQGFPVLLVTKNSVPAAAQKVLRDGGITRAVIVGDANAVAANVVNTLGSMGISVGRAGGGNRYATAKAVVDLADAEDWSTFRHFGVASGANFPDALTGAAEVGYRGGVILLTPPNILIADSESLLRRYAGSVESARLYGGEPTLQGAVLLGVKDIADR